MDETVILYLLLAGAFLAGCIAGVIVGYIKGVEEGGEAVHSPGPEAHRLRDGIRRIADHADKLTHLPATVIAPDLRALLDDREHHDG